MASGRFLSRSISENEVLADLGPDHALLFTWAIPHLDRDGRMGGHPAVVAGKVIPLFPGLHHRVEDILGDLALAGLILWYEVHGKMVVEFPRFRDHQKGLRYEKEAESRFPPPDHPMAKTVIGGKSPDGGGSGRGPAEVRPSSVPTPPEGKGREEKKKGMEGEGDEALSRLHPAALSVVNGLFHNATSVRAILKTRFLDPNGMPDDSVKGLKDIDEIARIVSEALVEYSTQAEGGRFQAKHFAGFVRRIRNAPKPGTEAYRMQDRREKGSGGYVLDEKLWGKRTPEQEPRKVAADVLSLVRDLGGEEEGAA